MKRIAFLLITILFVAVACEENVPDTEFTATYDASGEFWVTYEFDNGGVIADWYGVGHTVLSISNTAANTTDSVWITDHGNFWDYSVKTACTLDPITYSVVDGIDLEYDDTTQISNGQLFPREDGDSIYMEIVWTSDPTTTYIVSGRRYKGFLTQSGNPSYYADYPQD